MVTTQLLLDLCDKYQTKELTPAQIVVAALFGDNRSFQTYNPEKVYKRGDRIPYITEEGGLIIIICIQDNVTGTFNPALWEEYDVLEELLGINRDMIVLSWEQPALRRNKVWIEIKDESLPDAREIGLENESGIIVYKNFAISEYKPTMFDSLTLWGKVTEVSD